MYYRTSDQERVLYTPTERTKEDFYAKFTAKFPDGKSWMSICMYNLTRFDGKTIMNVLQTHPYTIIKGGIITKNPYYVHPDIWLAENAPEYL